MGAVAVVVVVIIVLFFVAMRLVGNNDPFQAAAAALNLKLTRSVPELLPRLEGMINGLPVIKDDFSDARKETNSATSSGVPIRPMGCQSLRALNICGRSFSE